MDPVTPNPSPRPEPVAKLYRSGEMPHEKPDIKEALQKLREGKSIHGERLANAIRKFWDRKWSFFLSSDTDRIRRAIIKCGERYHTDTINDHVLYLDNRPESYTPFALVLLSFLYGVNEVRKHDDWIARFYSAVPKERQWIELDWLFPDKINMTEQSSAAKGKPAKKRLSNSTNRETPSKRPRHRQDLPSSHDQGSQDLFAYFGTQLRVMVKSMVAEALLDTTALQHNVNVEEMKARHNEAMEDMNTRMASNESDALKLRQILTNCALSVREGQGALEAIRAELRQFREENEATRAKLQEENDAIRAELRQFQEENEATRAELQEENEATRAELRQFQEENEATRAELH